MSRVSEGVMSAKPITNSPTNKDAVSVTTPFPSSLLNAAGTKYQSFYEIDRVKSVTVHEVTSPPTTAPTRSEEKKIEEEATAPPTIVLAAVEPLQEEGHGGGGTGVYAGIGVGAVLCVLFGIGLSFCEATIVNDVDKDIETSESSKASPTEPSPTGEGETSSRDSEEQSGSSDDDSDASSEEDSSGGEDYSDDNSGSSSYDEGQSAITRKAKSQSLSLMQMQPWYSQQGSTKLEPVVPVKEESDSSSSSSSSSSSDSSAEE
eukprot:g14893.t1 g14893   contig21:100900-101747(+)